MLIITLLVSLLYLILLILILRAYYKNQYDIEKQLLNLQKEINDLKSNYVLDNQIIWNYLSKSGGDNMPCGKGKKKGGGRKK